MGVSSYITADTHRSIPVEGLAPYSTFPVYMVGPPEKGKKGVFLEEHYAGYQRFGGKSVPEFAAQINGVPEEGIGARNLEEIGWLILQESPTTVAHSVPSFAWKFPLVYPQFVESLDAVSELDFHQPPKRCPDQGWFLRPDGKGGALNHHCKHALYFC